MGKHAFSLKTIYLAALTAVFAVSFFAFVAFDLYSQQRQTEQAMLEEARTFAREMDAVWQFMDNSQSIINNSSSGGYEFKGLHCSVWARASAGCSRRAATTTSGTRTSTRAASRIFPTSSRRRRSRRSTPIVR